jgi:EmrB/QacA subfamily drug resistance transporter
VFLIVILAAQLMVVLDTTIVNVALPHIQQALDFSSSGLSWVLNAYILTFGGLLLLGARAGDLHGRRRVFLAGIALFTISSLVGGLAVTGWMLLTARAVQGVGAALAAPSALSLLTMVFPEGPERVRAIGLYTTVSAAGGALGLVSGGLLTELVSWRWVMFVNVPIGLAILVAGRRVLSESERRHGRFDLVGAITSTVGMSGIVFGLVESASAGWTSALTIGSLLAGVSLLSVFVMTERRAEEPVLPLRLVAHPTRSTANAARGLVYAGMYGMFFFVGQFLQDVQGYSALRAGVAFLPMPASVFLSSQVTSRVLVRRLPQKVVMLIGIGLSMVGLLLATQLQASASYAQIVGSLVLVGLGAGTSFVSLTSASLADVAPEDAGAASGLINVSQQLGAALGLAVLVTIFDSATHHTGAELTAAVFAHGLRVVCLVGAGFSVAALGLVALVVRPSKGRAIDDSDIDDLDFDEVIVEDDAAALADHAAIELV